MQSYGEVQNQCFNIYIITSMQSHNLIIIITVTNSHYHTSVLYKLSSRPVKQQICSQVIQSEITYN